VERKGTGMEKREGDSALVVGDIGIGAQSTLRRGKTVLPENIM